MSGDKFECLRRIANARAALSKRHAIKPQRVKRFEARMARLAAGAHEAPGIPINGIYRKVRAGRFPAPLDLQGRKAWLLADVEAWIGALPPKRGGDAYRAGAERHLEQATRS